MSHIPTSIHTPMPAHPYTNAPQAPHLIHTPHIPIHAKMLSYVQYKVTTVFKTQNTLTYQDNIQNKTVNKN